MKNETKSGAEEVANIIHAVDLGMTDWRKGIAEAYVMGMKKAEAIFKEVQDKTMKLESSK